MINAKLARAMPAPCSQWLMKMRSHDTSTLNFALYDSPPIGWTDI
jgi:hypothetical protein